MVHVVSCLEFLRRFFFDLANCLFLLDTFLRSSKLKGPWDWDGFNRRWWGPWWGPWCVQGRIASSSSPVAIVANESFSLCFLLVLPQQHPIKHSFSVFCRWSSVVWYVTQPVAVVWYMYSLAKNDITLTLILRLRRDRTLESLVTSNVGKELFSGTMDTYGDGVVLDSSSSPCLTCYFLFSTVKVRHHAQ